MKIDSARKGERAKGGGEKLVKMFFGFAVEREKMENKHQITITNKHVYLSTIVK
jgi:hypothetical protein